MTKLFLPFTIPLCGTLVQAQTKKPIPAHRATHSNTSNKLVLKTEKDSARSHSADEFIYTDEITNGIALYIELLNKVLLPVS